MRRLIIAIVPLAILAILLLPTTPVPAEGSTVAELELPPIEFTEIEGGVSLGNSLLRVEFYKDYDTVYDTSGDILIHEAGIVLQYLANEEWQQRGIPTSISWERINDWEYEVTRYYTDYNGTDYEVVFSVRSLEPVKVTINLHSGQTDEYRVLWSLSGITLTDYVENSHDITFEDYLVVDWLDVYQSFGNITATAIESQASGIKLDITFHMGTIDEGENLTIDPSYTVTVGGGGYAERALARTCDGTLWTVQVVPYSPPAWGIKYCIYHSTDGGKTWTIPQDPSGESACIDLTYWSKLGSPVIAADSGNNVWMFWRGCPVYPPYLWYAKWTSSGWEGCGEWDFCRIDDTWGPYLLAPSVAFDSNGDLHMVWTTANRVYYRTRVDIGTPDERWEPIEIVATARGGRTDSERPLLGGGLE